MKNFFLFETELSPDSGFELFEPRHLMWLFCITLFVILTSYWYKKKNEVVQKKLNRLMGVVFPVIAIYRDVVLILTGHFNVGFLPFHLCSMALWIAAFFAWTENHYAGVIYILLCVPGAVGALLFPDWIAYPFFHYMNIHDFISHGLIITFGMWLIASGKVVTRWKELWIPVVFGITGFAILYRMNIWLGTNYWFLNEPAFGSPMEWILKMTGKKWYLVGYFFFCSIVVVIWQSILNRMYRIFQREDKK